MVDVCGGDMCGGRRRYVDWVVDVCGGDMCVGDVCGGDVWREEEVCGLGGGRV